MQGKTLNKHLKHAAALCFAIGLAWTGLAAAQEPGLTPLHPSEIRVVVVNVERLLVDSQRARAAAAKIEAEFLPRRERVATQLRELRALSAKLEQDAAHLDDREKLVRARAVGELERTIRRAQAQISEDLMERKASERDALAQRIHAIVQKLPARLGVDVVLTRTVWHRPQIDVTDQVGAVLDR